MPSSLSQSTKFCSGLPGLSSVTELLDQSGREFIRQIFQHGIRPSSPLRRSSAADDAQVMASTAPQRTNALRHACRFECVVEPVSFTPITGLLGRKSIFADLCPAGISTAPPVVTILVPAHTRPSGGRRLLELFSRLKSCSFGLLSSYCRASDRINVRRTLHT
jgi:hypothetical protein